MITEQSTIVTIIIIGYSFCIQMADRVQRVVSTDTTCKNAKTSKQLKVHVQQKLKSDRDNCISMSTRFHMKLQLV